MKKIIKRIGYLLIALVVIGYVLPSNSPIIPVEGAGPDSWDHQTFWFYPWGKSVVHKGIDIFAAKNTPIIAPDYGIIIWTDSVPRGGNTAYLLTSKWRIHYFAHMNRKFTQPLAFLQQGDIIGLVGQTGNAQNRPPHLHYSISTPFPHFWQIDDDRQGWKKMFYLNPQEYLLEE
ncbi:MAG: M23 family metallopeptidase [Flammeovirgaceae bacterium]